VHPVECRWDLAHGAGEQTESMSRAVNVYPATRLTEGWYLNGS